MKAEVDGEVSEWRESFDECQSVVETLRGRAEEAEAEKTAAVKEIEKDRALIEELKEEKICLEEREAKLKTVAQKMKAELLRRREEERNRSEASLNLSGVEDAEKDERISSLEQETRELR